MRKIEYSSCVGESGYTALAEAIIEQACIDYIYALEHNNQYEKYNIERFFKSQWFEFLINIDGEYLLYILEEKYGRIDKSNDKKRDRKRNKEENFSSK